MTINETKTEEGITLSISGNVDTNTAPELQGKVLASFQKSGTLVLDMADCPYMSSAGLRVLLIGEKTAKSKKGSMKLVNVQPAVMKIFQVSNFSKILTIE